MDTAYLGLDIGTQGLKAVGVRTDGKVLWSYTLGYEATYPHPGWVEQSPADWECAVMDALDQAAQQPISWKGVGLTGQMHTTVVTNSEGEPLRPAILWSDQRTEAYVEQLKQQYGIEKLIEMTGNAPLTNFSALRLLWLRDHEPQIYQQISHVAVAKDWVRWRLTGQWGSDVSDASGTYLLDVEHRGWAKSWMHTLGIREEWWGPVDESMAVVGTMQVGPLAFRGLPVVAGAGDQAASAVGTGLQPGELGLSLGTSGVLFWPLARYVPAPDATIHAFCHAVPQEWHWMTVTQSAALSLRWFRDTFLPGEEYRAIDDLAATVSAGSEGVIFWPYLNGERAPIGRPQAVGGFYGLTAGHGRATMARSVMEGVAYSQKHCYDAMNQRGDIIADNIVMTGGGSQSALWAEMMATVFERPIVIIDDPGAAVGAAWLARNGVEGGRMAYPRSEKAKVHPNAAAIDSYREGYARYLAVIRQLMPLWQQ